MIGMYICEDKSLEKELNMWVTFYMSFKDYSKQNADLALHDNISSGKLEESAESLRKANFQWIEDLKKGGFSEQEIINYMPEAKEYCVVENHAEKVNSSLSDQIQSALSRTVEVYSADKASVKESISER